LNENKKKELLPELMAQEPRLELSLQRIIVIDNIPKVGTDKKDKLKKLMAGMVSKSGKIVSELYPEDENQLLKGYAYLYNG
jgi:translation initiation factor 3 subunit B